jgi:hypothetical protein
MDYSGDMIKNDEMGGHATCMGERPQEERSFTWEFAGRIIQRLSRKQVPMGY